MADKYIVTIEGAPSGTWTRVKTILGDVDWEYEKPEFSFPADDALLDQILSVEGVELIVGAPPTPEPEPEPEPKPKPKPKKAKKKATPKKKAAPEWKVVAGDTAIKVRCDECPPAELLAHRLEASSCSIEDASGEAVAHWP